MVFSRFQARIAGTRLSGRAWGEAVDAQRHHPAVEAKGATLTTLGIVLPDRELACAPIKSELGQDYLGAMRAAINCALANRQILTHLVRDVFHALARCAASPRRPRRPTRTYR